MGTRADVFADIYRRNGWNGIDGVGAGPGSTPDATAAIAAELPRTVGKLRIESIVDAGCGDGMWVPDLPIPYVGLDVVPEVVERCRARFPDRDYRVLDFVTEPIPLCDAVLCRDALQHLPLADGIAALDNFARAGARFLLASSHRGYLNRDVPPGGWYPVNLESSPFGLGAPVRSLPDDAWPGGPSPWPEKVFGVWEL